MNTQLMKVLFLKNRMIVVLLAVFSTILLMSCERDDIHTQDGSPVYSGNPLYRSVNSKTFPYGTKNINIQQPMGTKDGDLLILIMAKDGYSLPAPSNEEGWVRIVSERYGDGDALISAWWKKATYSDPDKYTFSLEDNDESGRIDLICIKNWNGSAPTAKADVIAGNSQFQAPAIPLISNSGGDLIISTIAITNEFGLSGVQWKGEEGFVPATNLSMNEVSMSSFYKQNLNVIAPSNQDGNIFKTSDLSSNQNAGVISFIVPAKSDRPIIRIYRGGASRTIENGEEFYVTTESLIDKLSKPDLGYDVRSIGENEVDKVSPKNLEKAALYIQPGGPTIEEGWPYLADHKNTIRNFVDKGGKYLGICFGAYMLRNDYPNMGFNLLPSGNYAYSYSSFPGEVYDENEGTQLIKINLMDIWGSGSRWVVMDEGNYFDCSGGVPDLAVLATYREPISQPIAAIRFSYNPSGDQSKGWVVGIGPHPEADPETWDSPIDPDGEDFDLLEKAVADLLQR